VQAVQISVIAPEGRPTEVGSSPQWLSDVLAVHLYVLRLDKRPVIEPVSFALAFAAAANICPDTASLVACSQAS
jgi:hypothetical protein